MLFVDVESRYWLSPPDPSRNYNTARGLYLDGTTMWFFREDHFNKWNACASLLWIHGKRLFFSFNISLMTMLISSVGVAGSGKSILMYVFHANVVCSYLPILLGPRSSKSSAMCAGLDWHGWLTFFSIFGKRRSNTNILSSPLSSVSSVTYLIPAVTFCRVYIQPTTMGNLSPLTQHSYGA